MLLPKAPPDHWRLLTRNNVTLRKVFPWGESIQKILWQAQPIPFTQRNVFIASDYSGEHKGARYKVYAFLVADSSPSEFRGAMKRIRKTILTDGRRLSFKQLSDPARQAALVPYLQAADTLTGHLVVIAVDKRIKWLVARKGEMCRWQDALHLNARWTDHAFEDMARKGYMTALFLSLWSRPMMNVDWITDQDQAVANMDRLDDTHRFAARMASLLLPHDMGEFGMNSTVIDEPDRALEDVCALPDLVAGMASDICTALARQGGWLQTRRLELSEGAISGKAAFLADWFWHTSSRLNKTMIQMDRAATGYTVRQVWQQSGWPDNGELKAAEQRPA
jgi:hypothetical protein